MNIKAKFCKMSTKFGTMYLSLLDCPSHLWGNLCDVFIVPEDSALPTSRFVCSSRYKAIFALPIKENSYDGLSPLSTIMDKPDSFIVELDIMDSTDIFEIQKSVEEAVKWKQYWQDVTFPSEDPIFFVANLPDSRYYANFS